MQSKGKSTRRHTNLLHVLLALFCFVLVVLLEGAGDVKGVEGVVAETRVVAEELARMLD